ncbi:hypothetical protein TNIN_468561 [Trichonephila inaurata madagascariensis]|uniref:Uncharacterized protein n=1 Tax=Trichonephila inaurata madagascariensis TaxID=2747483 RepID=A0A8X6JFI7_9ARAC|nr:hypothetical protein TNIN_468561 [Trichonephila inaurata madagascariensis]
MRRHGSATIHYVFVACAIFVLIVLVLSCLCSVQEREAKSNREVKYTAPKKVKKRPASTSNSRMVPSFNSDKQSLNSLASDKKSEPEIQYFWGDQQEARTTESCTDDKLIKV